MRRVCAFLPDYVRAGVGLAALPDLPICIAFAGHRFSLSDLAAEIMRQTGQPLALSRFPCWAMSLAAPVWELARDMSEMR